MTLKPPWFKGTFSNVCYITNILLAWNMLSPLTSDINVYFFEGLPAPFYLYVLTNKRHLTAGTSVAMVHFFTGGRICFELVAYY